MKQNWEKHKKHQKENNADESDLVKMRYQI